MFFGQDLLQAGTNFLLQRFELFDLFGAQRQPLDHRRRQDLTGAEHRWAALWPAWPSLAETSGPAFAWPVAATFPAFRSTFAALSTFRSTFAAFSSAFATFLTSFSPLFLPAAFFGRLSGGKRCGRQAAGGQCGHDKGSYAHQFVPSEGWVTAIKFSSGGTDRRRGELPVPIG